MSITSVCHIKSDSQRQQDGVEEVDTYRVITDENENAQSVRTSGHEDLPGFGDQIVEGSDPPPYLTVTNVKVTRDENSKGSRQVFYYEVYWTYPQSEYVENPLDRDPIISWQPLEFVEYQGKDLNDYMFTSSALEMYDPSGLPTYARGGIVTITRNEGSNPGTNVVAFSKTTNNADWHGVAVENGMIQSITATKKRENYYVYWEVTYTISLKPGTKAWRVKIYDNGSYYYDDANGPKFIWGNDGSKIRVWLNGTDGNKLADQISDAKVIYPPDGFKNIATADWSTLDLPNPFAD